MATRNTGIVDGVLGIAVSEVILDESQIVARLAR
jgi:hypothetical protein